MAIHKIFSSLNKKATISSYVGEAGRIFYDPENGQIRLSNGTTPGGVAVSISANVVVSESLLPEVDNIYSIGTGSLRWSHIHLGDGGIYFDGTTYPEPQTVPYLPGAIVADLIPYDTSSTLKLGSSTHRWGNLYIGPNSIHLQDQTTLNDIEMTVSNGTLYLNGAQNLAVGNLVILDTTLTTATPSLDINIGNADDTGLLYVPRKTQFDNTTFGPTEAMVSMNASGTTHPDTIFPDTVLQIVGRPNKSSRIIQRSYGSSGTVGGDNSYAVWGSYVARGNVSNPSAIKQNDILSRLSSNGYGTTTWGSGGTRIESVALENFTDSAKGSKINFWTTPVGSIVSQQVASITTTGISANSITFTTDGTTQTTAGIPMTFRGNLNATKVATLGVDGTLDTSQIPSSLVGGVIYKGGWDATSNTAPSLGVGLPAGVQSGWEYSITTTGTQNIGSGSQTYNAGGFVVYNGSAYDYIPPVSNFTSLTAGTHLAVNTPTGAITVTVDATPNATAGTIVSRDSSGNFAANVITAALSGQATSAITAATVTAGVQTAITQVGTLTSLAVSGNVTTGNVSGTKGTFTTVAGTLSTAAQTNITSVGTLTSLDVSGNVTAANLVTTGTITDSIGAVRSIPQNGKNTGYTLQATDNGQMINITTGNVTVPAGVFNSPYGQTVSIFNNQNFSNAVVQGSGVTLRLAGTTATGNRTLARYGVATMICVAANTFVISGAGLS